jgi:hypothetical protein
MIARSVIFSLLLLASPALAETQVRVNTTPAGATLVVDGTPREVAPTTLTDLTPGTHLIVARKDGFRETRESFALLAGQKLALDLKLDELRGLALIHASPTGAEVYVDGAFRGLTPLLLPDVPLGTHRVQITAPGFFPKEVDLTVPDRIPLKIAVELVADSASVDFSSEPAGAAVLINGSSRGTTPLRVDQIPSGETEVVLQLEGYAPHREKLVLKAGETVRVEARLTSQPGALSVVAQPEPARIYVNNEFRGETPLDLQGLAPGEYRLRAERRGFETDARTVQVRADTKTTEEFRLQKNSGVLVLVTEPPGVKVFVDGVEVGETSPSAAGLLSERLTVELLARGEHTLQLNRPGWIHRPQKFTIDTDQAVTLHEKMTRLFIPDILVRTSAGEGGTRTGVLLREYPNGDLEVEVRPGVIERIKGKDVIERRAIRDGARN